MCGISGALDLGRATGQDELEGMGREMSMALRHRGPDADGVWAQPAEGVVLSFRRLAIIDRSPHGDQPMASASGRWTMVFNGEIYNFRDLRKALESGGHVFRGRSDSEVLVEAVAAWGPEAALERANGMFALALWDARHRRLLLARDRMGEKPLYFGRFGRWALFGSELRALRTHPAFENQIDQNAVRDYFRFGYVPGDACVWKGVRKVAPASILSIDSSGAEKHHQYWSLNDVAARGAEHAREAPLPDLADELESLLADSVRLRTVADVPLGAFLSGGIDSSTVVALMAAHSRTPVRTFTIGFDEDSYDESAEADAVARHLQTHHTTLRVTPQEALAVVPEMPAIYDEPFADASQMPTLLVSRLAGRDVTVALSGDGGDELFGGYTRYLWHSRLRRSLRMTPVPLRQAVASAIEARSPDAWDATLLRMLPKRARGPQLGDKLLKGAGVLRAADDNALYEALMGHWPDHDDLVVGANPRANEMRKPMDSVEQLMLADQQSYLPDDILVKVDRASMSCGLEVRVPMLDHRLVEYAWRLPARARIHGGQGKQILRTVLRRYVPPDFVDRPKMGFGVPIGAWLRGPLREWAEDLLNPVRLERHGLLDADLVQARWHEHLSGTRDRKYQLWDVLMLQAWLEHWERP